MGNNKDTHENKESILKYAVGVIGKTYATLYVGRVCGLIINEILRKGR